MWYHIIFTPVNSKKYWFIHDNPTLEPFGPIGFTLIFATSIVKMIEINKNTILKLKTWKIEKMNIAELKNGTTRYFAIPSSCILKEIPARCINPDAYNIGICYERVINKKVNGVYSHKLRQLKMSSFGIPFILYRTLMLDGLSERQFPIEYNGNVVFPNISSSVVKELNRILCNSIVYE